jgi:hypothetical protein
MSYRDKNLTCSDCHRPFTFSAEDQGLSGELGYDRPVCCGTCRSSRETTRRQTGRDAAPVGRIARMVPVFSLPVPAELPL